MTTSSTKLNATTRKLIEKADLKDRFFDYLNDQTIEMVARVYDAPGVFSPKLGITGSGADQFDITGDSLATDGIGHILNTAAEGSFCQDVTIENAISDVYEISLHYVEGVAYGSGFVQANPSTGVAEYVALRDYIGEIGEPDSVSLSVDDVIFVIDSLCEAGVSHAGRKALVYLNSPVSSVHSVAIQELTIAYSGGENKITVASNKLGQSTASTTAGDYTVIVLGPTVRKNSSKLGVSGYVVLGSIAGVGAGSDPGVDTGASISTAAQPEITISLSNVNDAFQSFAALRSTTLGGAGKKSPMSVATWGAGSAVWGAQIFAFGGLTSPTDETTPTTTVRSYDTETDAWSSLTSMPDAYNALVSAATVGDLIYVFGGHNGTITPASTLARVYDPIGGGWSTVTAMPAGRAGGKLLALGTDLYYISGQPQPGSAGSVSCYKYDTANDSWSGIADLPSGKARANAVVHNGLIYVLGGSEVEGSQHGNIDESGYVYTPSSNSWAAVADHPATAYGVPYGGTYMAASVEHNGVIHFVSGGGATQTTAGLHRAYNPIGDTWAELPAPKAPYLFGSVYGLVDGVLYMFGGRTRNTPVPEGASAISNGFAISIESVASSSSVGTVTDVGTIGTSAAGTVQLSDMTAPRTRHGACPLKGAMLLTGGFDAGSVPLKSAELYWPESQIRIAISDMPDYRIEHGAVAIEGDKALIFMGRPDAAPTAIDTDIWIYDMHTDTWAVHSAAAGVDRAGYAIAKSGSMVYFAGGNDTAGASQDDVFAWDLTKNKMLATAVGDHDSTLAFGAAVAFGEDLIMAGPDDAIRAMKIRPTGEIGATLNPFNAVTDLIFDGGTAQMAIGVWSGSVYVYVPGEAAVIRYDPAALSVETIASGLSFDRYGAQLHFSCGRMYIFGGSTSLLGTAGSNDVFAVSLEAPELEASNEPTNYTTGKSGSSIAFGAGQTYGSVVHDAYTSADHVRLTAESNF